MLLKPPKLCIYAGFGGLFIRRYFMKLDYYYDDPLLDYYDVSKDELELELL